MIEVYTKPNYLYPEKVYYKSNKFVRQFSVDGKVHNVVLTPSYRMILDSLKDFDDELYNLMYSTIEKIDNFYLYEANKKGLTECLMASMIQEFKNTFIIKQIFRSDDVKTNVVYVSIFVHEGRFFIEIMYD